MYPSYKWTDSYPHHANPMHYAPIDDPRAKEIPFPVKSTMNSPYQPWPYGFNYCYPFPHEYHHPNHNHNHGCCNHGYFGGASCSFHPPYPHYPPPSPFHTHGFYPPFPGTYPAYSVPPQHYSVEQPRYDYDKNNHQCCGCNHREDENKSRIEHKEPEVDKKTSDSLVPLFLKDCPYPIMWVPPHDMKTETQKENSSREPVAVKPLEPSRRVEIARDQQSGDGDHFPFPIFWLPSKKNEVGKDTNENNLDLVAHNGLPDENERDTRKNEEGSGSKAESEKPGKHVVQKVIPVKQLGADEEKKKLKGIETKAKSDSLEKASNGKGSPKSSKLPPVCLRIDPLPRKKSSSRSPSPPADKQRSEGSPVDTPKCCQQHTQLSQSLKKNMDEQSKGNIKTIEVTSAANKIEKDRLPDHVPKGEVSESQSGVLQGQSSEGEPYKVEEMKKTKKNLSEHEAAVIIQSVYRGFEVRKSQPLIKLKQISQVRKQVIELRDHIRDLESSSTNSVGDKQKLIIGETIMSLLLKLDTIQGLHPIVRDGRKSVAKELVGLQEKLDSLKSETPVKETMSSTKQPILTEHDAIHESQPHSDKNVKLVESGSGLCENHQVEATQCQDDDDGAETYNTNVEPQHDEKCSRELNNNQLQHDAIQEKFDQALTQSDCINGGLEVEDMKLEQSVEVEENTTELNSNQLEIPMEAAIQDKSYQAQSDSDNNVESVESSSGICEPNEVEPKDDDINFEGQVEAGSQLVIPGEAQQLNNNVESGSDICEVESEDNGVTHINIEGQVESGSQLVIPETGEQDKSDEAQAQAQAQAQLEGDGEVEAIDDGNVQVEMKVEEDAMQMQMQEDLTEEAPKVDDNESSVEDIGGVGGGDRKLLEENEKLRVAVEELMKAGNQQLNVINKLAGKVKDLEKKLSRKKKIKLNKCKSRGSLVKE